MPAPVDALSICRLALQKGGFYTTNDTGPRGPEMERAREWLDLVVGNISARRRCWWLHPETAVIPLTAGTASYDLNAAVGQQLAPNGVDYPTSAYLARADGSTVKEIAILRREEWEGMDRIPADRGEPCFIHIDRAKTPTLRIHPPPLQDGEFELRIVFQAVTADLTKGLFSDRMVNFHDAWKLCLVVSLAAQLIDGPIRKFPQDEVRDMKAEAEKLLSDLETFNSMEHANEPRPVAFFNGIGR